MRTLGVFMACWLGLANATSGGVVLSFTLADGSPLPTEVEAGDTYSLGLQLTNLEGPTSALSAYMFDFSGGDFGTGDLDASNWQESNLLVGLFPAWVADDQSLATESGNFRVSGVSGSLSTPFVGPGLPINDDRLIGTFDVLIDATPGSVVDFLLSPASGIDDEMGRLAGGGLVTLGVTDVPVVPEPSSLLLLFLGGSVVLRRCCKRDRMMSACRDARAMSAQ